MPRKLIFETPPRKRLDLPESISPTVEPVNSVRVRKPLFDQNPNELTHRRTERPRTPTDDLIDRIRDRDPSLDPARLRGRLDILLSATTDTILQWGEANLIPLQKASDIQARISKELQRIDASQHLNDAKNAVMAKKGMLGFLSKKPEFYEDKFRTAKVDLLKLAQDTDREYRAFVPEVSDLHLDSSTLGVVLGTYQDTVLLNVANSRLKTLLMAHQTGQMLLTVLENTIQQCSQYVEQIDSMLSVTIPQWKMSKG